MKDWRVRSIRWGWEAQTEHVQVAGDVVCCVLLRMSPRARTAMRTDSSWSARAIGGDEGQWGRWRGDRGLGGGGLESRERREDEQPLWMREAHEFDAHHATTFTCVAPPIQILSSRPSVPHRELVLPSPERPSSFQTNNLRQNSNTSTRQLSTTWESGALTPDTTLNKQI